MAPRSLSFTRSLRGWALVGLLLTAHTTRVAALQPYSVFAEFNFNDISGGFGFTPPADHIFAIEHFSGQFKVEVGDQIASVILFSQRTLGSPAEGVIYPLPQLVSSTVPTGTGVRDTYVANHDISVYYYGGSTCSIGVLKYPGYLDGQASVSLTGYLIPLSTVWTGITSIPVGTMREVTSDELQLAETLELGSAVLTLSGPNITPGGALRVGAGKQLRFTATTPPSGPRVYSSVNYNGGLIELSGNATSASEIEFVGSLVNAPSTGLISGQSAMMRFTGGLDNYGAVAFTAGVNNIHGEITTQAGGKLSVTAGAQAVFYDDVVQNGTLRVAKVGSTTSVAVFLGAFTGSGGTTGGGDIFFEGDLRPGNSPAVVTFANNIGLGGDANTSIELGGTASGQFDQLNVTGSLALDGALSISLVDGYQPEVGASFDILNWDSLSGTFASVSLPALAGGRSWNTSQLYTAGVLSVVSVGLPGDYNGNGTVDAADFVVWRDGGPLANEVDTPGVVNAADYTAWRARFGNTSGSGGGMAAAVPEPVTIALAIMATAGTFSQRRWAARLPRLVLARQLN